MAHAVSAENVSFAYGKRQALNCVNFTAEESSVHGFLGPNGSGKSTLFKLLATILPLQAGKVSVLGLDLRSEMNSLRRRIGVVFQAPALDRKLSLRQNLVYGGHMQGLRGTDLSRRVDEMLEHCKLADRAGERVEDLSGGLRRRVELAKGMLHKPDLLLLDEPSTGLDPGARKDLWNFLRSQKGLTVLFTTHLMDEAEQADCLTILHEGAVVAEGSPQDLRSEIGDEILEINCAQPKELATRLESSLGVMSQVFEKSLRIQAPEAHKIVADLMQSHRDEVERLSLSRPTLEDVFILKTGHRFWADDGEEN